MEALSHQCTVKATSTAYRRTKRRQHHEKLIHWRSTATAFPHYLKYLSPTLKSASRCLLSFPSVFFFFLTSPCLA